MKTAAPTTSDGQPVRTEQRSDDGFSWQGALQLAKLLLTGLPLLRFFTIIGLVLLPMALIAYPFSRMVAYGISVWAGICILGFSYFGAATQLRVMVSNRRLGLLPGFAFTCALLLLAHTALLAVLFPLQAWLFGIQLPTDLVAMRIFSLATLYSVFSCAVLSARRVPMLFTSLQLLGLCTLYLFNRIASGWWSNPQVMLVIFSISAAVWVWMLIALRGRQRFAQVLQSAGLGSPLMHSTTGNDYMQQFSYQPWLFRERSMPPATTLLLGHAGDWRGRCQNLGTTLILSPALCATVVWFIGNSAKRSFIWFDQFLFLHLCIAGILPLVWGELAARSRCLWLRHGGQRSSLWQFVESEMWRNFLLMSALGSALIVLRLWPAWLQIVYLIGLSSGLGALAYVLRGFQPGSWVLASSLIMLLLALVYRYITRKSFVNVDWLRLKPAAVSRNTASG